MRRRVFKRNAHALMDELYDLAADAAARKLARITREHSVCPKCKYPADDIDITVVEMRPPVAYDDFLTMSSTGDYVRVVASWKCPHCGLIHPKEVVGEAHA